MHNKTRLSIYFRFSTINENACRYISGIEPGLNMFKKLREYLRSNEEAHQAYQDKLESEINRKIEFSPLPNSLRDEIEGCMEESFQLEVLNDETTTMEFVTRLFEILGFNEEQARACMINIHESGSAKVLSSNERNVRDLADFIHGQASANGYPLKCLITNITKSSSGVL